MAKKMTYKFGVFLLIIVFARIIIGLRVPSAMKKKHTWNIGETTSKFTITLPKNYSAELLEVKNGHFQSMFIKGPKNVEESERLQISIRTGYFPTYKHDEIHFDNYHSGKTSVRFLNQDVEFLSFEYDKQTYLMEQILSLENVKRGLRVDLCLIASDKKGIEELVKIIGTLQLENASSVPVPKVLVIDAQTKGVFNKQRQIVKYGTFIYKDKIITGSQYYYNKDSSLSQIEIYQDGIYIRDSTFVK